MKRFPSLFEAKYVIYPDISYDREQLVEFFDHYNSLDPEKDKEELSVLDEVLNGYSKRRIQGLLDNDENISRICVIEKYARIAAREVILTGKYSMDTFRTVTNFPIADYQLFVKRSKEIVKEIKGLISQKEDISKNIGNA